MARSESFFQRLTRLFKSGPSIRRQVKGHDHRSYYDAKLIQGNYGYQAPAPFGFGRENSPFSVLGSYGILDRMARYAEFCLAGDTRIATPNSEQGSVPIKELVKRFRKGEKLFAYSYDTKNNKTVCAPISNAWLTKTAPLYEVTLDNGAKIYCTDNHPWMLRDGTYKRTDKLEAGCAIMPFKRRNFKTPYRYIYSFREGWRPEHVIVAEGVTGKKVDKKSGLHVHHKNFISIDNKPENLHVMTAKDHLAYHLKLNRKIWDNEDHRKFMSNFMKNRWSENGDLRIHKDENFNKRKKTKSWQRSLGRLYRYNKEYRPGRHNKGRTDQKKLDNANADKLFTVQNVYDVFAAGDSITDLSRKLNVSTYKIVNRIKWAGWNSFKEFSQKYTNHKVVSVRLTEHVEPVYDIEVGTYHNFAIVDKNLNDVGFVHNSEMEYTPEIAAAMDIYSDEIVGGDDRGRSFHIYSDNASIKRNLEELFYDVLNVEFNLRAWARNLVKYGDFFLYNEVLPEIGVINAQPIPVSDIEREEGFDEDDPYAVRFKWITRGNVYLENWQVTHMRILGNDLFLPYGTAALEPARRIWRQLIMMEDAMLVYRVVRSPERRVFYVDVASVAPNDVPSYMEAVKSTLRSHSIIEKSTGRQDMRYNPLAVDEDYYIPVRGTQSGTKIETLAGGQHVTATEDVQYIQSKLFAALKVPKPYLNYDENLSSKATLAQEDVRFSRTIGGIQKIILSEMNKLAMIHLFAKGFDGEDLINFELKLSNPSSVAVQQKLELWATKADVAGTLRDTKLVDERWIQKNVLELTDDDVNSINKGLYEDRIRETQLDAVAFEDEVEKNTTTDTFNPANYHMSGKNVPKSPAPPDEIQNKNYGTDIVGPAQKNNPFKINYTKGKTPIKATPFLTRNRKNRIRRVGQSGRDNTASPDFNAMLNPRTNRSLRDVFDMDFLRSPAKRESFARDFTNEFNPIKTEPVLPSDVKSILNRLKDHIEKTKSKKGVITETIDIDVEKDEDETILEFVVDEKQEEGDFNTKTSLKEVMKEIDNEDTTNTDIESIELELE